MKETVKKNARERCFQERVSTDWRKHIEYFVKKLAAICISMSKTSSEHKRNVLQTLHRCCKYKQ